jgi:hypothetical protein
MILNLNEFINRMQSNLNSQGIESKAATKEAAAKGASTSWSTVHALNDASSGSSAGSAAKDKTGLDPDRFNKPEAVPEISFGELKQKLKENVNDNPTNNPDSFKNTINSGDTVNKNSADNQNKNSGDSQNKNSGANQITRKRIDSASTVDTPPEQKGNIFQRAGRAISETASAVWNKMKSWVGRKSEKGILEVKSQWHVKF